MFKFNVSAPGRVFLYGDPVRYKELCTAASLNMRTKLTFSSMLPPGHPYFIDINFSSIKLHVKILLGAFYMHFSNKHIYSVLSDTELHGMVRNFVGSLKEYVGTYEPDNRAHRLSLEAFFFLLLRIAYERNVKITTSFKVEVSTELAIGEGLGSSASFATCLAACFYRWALLQQGVAVYIFNDEHLIDISKYVQSCDCTIYNSPTVIDSMICVYGSVQTFEKEVLLNMYCDMPNIKILLVFSNVSQKTTVEQGEHVERTLRSYPFVESIQKNIDNVVQRSRKIFGGIEKKLRRSSEIHNISCDSEEDLFHLVPTISGVKLKVSAYSAYLDVTSHAGNFSRFLSHAGPSPNESRITMRVRHVASKPGHYLRDCAELFTRG